MISDREKAALAKAMVDAVEKYAPIGIVGLTSSDRYEGIPVADSAILEDDSVVLVKRRRFKLIYGRPVALILCEYQKRERLVGLEYRGQIIFPERAYH